MSGWTAFSGSRTERMAGLDNINGVVKVFDAFMEKDMADRESLTKKGDNQGMGFLYLKKEGTLSSITDHKRL